MLLHFNLFFLSRPPKLYHRVKLALLSHTESSKVGRDLKVLCADGRDSGRTKYFGSQNAKKNSTIVFYSLFYNLPDWEGATATPPLSAAPFRRPWMVSHTSSSPAGLSSLGVPGVPWHPQILAYQLTLSQPVGADYAPTSLLTPPDFQTFLRPCPVTEGFRTMHPTLKPCYRALGTKGAGVNPPPQI